MMSGIGIAGCYRVTGAATEKRVTSDVLDTVAQSAPQQRVAGRRQNGIVAAAKNGRAACAAANGILRRAKNNVRAAIARTKHTGPHTTDADFQRLIVGAANELSRCHIVAA